MNPPTHVSRPSFLLSFLTRTERRHIVLFHSTFSNYHFPFHSFFQPFSLKFDWRLGHYKNNGVHNRRIRHLNYCSRHTNDAKYLKNLPLTFKIMHYITTGKSLVWSQARFTLFFIGYVRVREHRKTSAAVNYTMLACMMISFLD